MLCEINRKKMENPCQSHEIFLRMIAGCRLFDTQRINEVREELEIFY